jgi:hypothetical protein
VASLQVDSVGIATALSPVCVGHFKFSLSTSIVGLGITATLQLIYRRAWTRLWPDADSPASLDTIKNRSDLKKFWPAFLKNNNSDDDPREKQFTTGDTFPRSIPKSFARAFEKLSIDFSWAFLIHSRL